jgi:hypothetical protein
VTSTVVDQGGLAGGLRADRAADGRGMSGTEPIVGVEIEDGIAQGVAEYARGRTTMVIRRFGQPVRRARVRLSRRPRQVVTPVVAQVSLDVDDHPVRVQAAGANPWEAMDRVEVRLEARLEHVAAVRRGPCGVAVRGGAAWSHPAPVTVDESGHVLERHKVIVLEICSVDEAIAEMDFLDSTFHLFVERGSGRDSLVSRDYHGSYHLQQITSPGTRPGDSLESFDLDVEIDDDPVRALTQDQAIQALHRSDRSFLFFLDHRRGRGGVVYRRRDGAFGQLITLR